MRVTWVILTLGLLWTGHVQSEVASDKSGASTAATMTTDKVTTAITSAPAAASTTNNVKVTTPTTSTPATLSTTNDVRVMTTAASAPTTASTITTTGTVTTPATSTPATAGTTTVGKDNTTDTGTTITPTNISTLAPEEALNTSPNSGPTPSASGSPTTTGDGVASTAPHITSSTSASSSSSSSASASSSSSARPSGPGGDTSGSVPTSVQPPTTATATLKTTTVLSTTTTTLPTTTLPTPFTFFFSKMDKEGDPILIEICSRLLEMITGGNCSISGRKTKGHHQFDKIYINGDVNISVVERHYKELNGKMKESLEESDYTTLIAILASCGAVALIIVGLAIYTYRHGNNYRKNQQHLTEELQTVENGYHDNPTLEVMEVQPDTVLEKRPNGELNDSWIVPIDNLLKEELPDEEDTHL
ncbi:podocalyxin isoform X2 [Alosa sapidissima]|uniref:podocalyxin isoform X2 n=1 Tax=Alosa sapidissima TaxID=34773 RepID=UPI001C084371|nr:podocalyxin isoform X2 [Alosa sapidissima]